MTAGAGTSSVIQTGVHHAVEMIEPLEGYSSKAYWDPWGKVWTVGFGETENVNQWTTRTRVTAEAFLFKKLTNIYLPPILALPDKFNENQIAALLSFDYNLGPNIFSDQYSVGRDLRAHNLKQAADDMLAFDHAGGVVLAGLVYRRREERRVFLEPVPAAPDPFHYLRFVDTNFKVLGNHWINERKTVELYDKYRTHPKDHLVELHVLRQDLDLLWKRIYIVAHWDLKPHEHPNWDFAHRGYRLRQMRLRSMGQRVGVNFQP